MRITSKVFFFLAFLSIFGSSVFASSPFDIILNRLPDLAVTDIHQESNYLYMRACNLGGSLTDSDTSLALAMKRSGGGIVSTIEPIILGTNECHEFRVASLDELGINTSGTYSIYAGVVLRDGKVEKGTDNNKMTRSMSIAYGITNQSPAYYMPTYYNTTNYCNSSNNYCANNTPYNGSTTYYRANICPPYDIACNNSYYNSTNTQYQNNNNQYCTYSNNYCANTSNYNYQYDKPDLVVQRVYQNFSDKHIIAQICNQGGDMRNATSIRTNFSIGGVTRTVYNTLQIGRGQCTSDVIYITPQDLNISYSGNYSISATVDVNNNVDESNDSNNTCTLSFYIETFQNQKPDLVIDRISANDSTQTITTRICNIGDDMPNYNNWTIEITNTTTNTLIRNSGSRLMKGGCMDMSTGYSNLGIYRSGGYNFRAIVDTDNIVSEQSEWNNTLNQYLQIWRNY